MLRWPLLVVFNRLGVLDLFSERWQSTVSDFYDLGKETPIISHSAVVNHSTTGSDLHCTWCPGRAEVWWRAAPWGPPWSCWTDTGLTGRPPALSLCSSLRTFLADTRTWPVKTWWAQGTAQLHTAHSNSLLYARIGQYFHLIIKLFSHISFYQTEFFLY